MSIEPLLIEFKAPLGAEYLCLNVSISWQRHKHLAPTEREIEDRVFYKHVTPTERNECPILVLHCRKTGVQRFNQLVNVIFR